MIPITKYHKKFKENFATYLPKLILQIPLTISSIHSQYF